MKKFTEIGQFRNVVRAVKTNHDFKGIDENGNAIYLHTEQYPILRFRGEIIAISYNTLKNAEQSIAPTLFYRHYNFQMVRRSNVL